MAPNLDAESDPMSNHSPDEVTRLLGEIAAGNEEAKCRLFECVYDELYGMAKHKMRQERGDHSLGATGLVHEVYLRLRGRAISTNRAYFFGAAAKAMYRILVEHARQPSPDCVSLDLVLHQLESTHRVPMLDLHDALEGLKERGDLGKRQHDVVVQRFFGGLPWKEIAANLGVAVTTAEKDWQAARALLYKTLN